MIWWCEHSEKGVTGGHMDGQMDALNLPFIAAWSQLKIILSKISPKFVPTGEIDNTSALIKVMPWHQNRWQCSTWNNDDPGLSTHIYAYVGLWTMSLLIQIMACHLLSPKPLLAPKLNYCSLDLGSKLQWNLNLNKLIFFHKNASENIICKISTILLSSCIDTSKIMSAMPLPTHMKKHPAGSE